MKLFFISDIHGSFEYLEKALEFYKKEEADYIVLLGDVLYHGARNPLPKGHNPKEVAKLLNSYKEKIIAIRGNCDSEVDQMVLDFPITADYSVLINDNRKLFLTHGHVYNKDNLKNLSEKDVLIYGHTHIPVAEKTDSFYLFNPGSISLPKENNPNSYGILEDNLLMVKDFEENTIKSVSLS